MQIILLSGGSGKRLWPLSNGTRSKQFLRLLPTPDGNVESMVQRVVRQMNEAGLPAEITVATSQNQKDSIQSQLGKETCVVTEPERRDTFPAIALATAYLAKERQLSDDEVVVVMPCDPYTEAEYFHTIDKMVKEVEAGLADLVLMGIRPTEPSEKFGYLVPDKDNPSIIRQFTEKPDHEKAVRLLEEGAVWNGGVFAFKLGYLKKICDKYLPTETFEEFRNNYTRLPKISFDYEVAEKADSVGVVYFDGAWKDLGTWDSLSRELAHRIIGNAHEYNCSNTTAINELNIPLVCHGTKDLIVAASPDGILVAEKAQSESIKESLKGMDARPMYEERRWGTYKVIDNVDFNDGYAALTKTLTLNPGCSISYQRHTHRDEVWTFIDGHGEIVLDGVRKPVSRGDVITIPKMMMHALRATTPLTFIEVQRGDQLVEEDIERFDYEW